MTVTVGTATPGTIGSVGTATPGTIGSVSNSDGSQYTSTTEPWIEDRGSLVYNADGSYITAPVYVDPYAKYGGLQAFNNLQAGFTGQEQGILGTANAALDKTTRGYNDGVLNYLANKGMGQKALDLQGTKTELAKMQGVQGIQGMVGRGIRSAGTMLSNKNASDSSATQGIANAYGQLGRQQMSGIGNQYANAMGENQLAQEQFDISQASALRGLQGSKEDSVNSIVSDVGTQLAALDAQMLEADMPTRVAIEQRKGEIRANAVAKLQGLDTQLSTGNAGIVAQSNDQRLSSAGELGREGTNLGQDAFQYQTQAPMQFQGNAPSGGSLPIYTMPRGRRAG